ncbi:hypothetical protein A3Q56_05084 [Intoshia linei]|uniref:Uncharacterized protein n=1 Tax=Intoshia linei TaxID=1819745 RepID=A0A177AYR5_9BILA|nr:hypothetical protein A3Q56_05084 [Intoshia linei]
METLNSTLNNTLNLDSDKYFMKHSYAILGSMVKSNDSAHNLIINEIELLKDTLQSVDVTLCELPNDKNFPHTCFVGELVVIIDNTACICKPPSHGKTNQEGDLTLSEKIRSNHFDINWSHAKDEHHTIMSMLAIDLKLTVCTVKSQQDNNLELLFISDWLIVIDGVALLCRPANVLMDIVDNNIALIRDLLNDFGLNIFEVDSDCASVVGSDVLWTGSEIIVGLNQYTNIEGAQFVASIFTDYSTSIVKISDPTQHLKSLISMINYNVMCAAKNKITEELLLEMERVGIHEYKIVRVTEEDAVNLLSTNGWLLHVDPSQIPNSIGILNNKIHFKKKCVKFEELTKLGRKITDCVVLVPKNKHFDI